MFRLNSDRDKTFFLFLNVYYWFLYMIIKDAKKTHIPSYFNTIFLALIVYSTHLGRKKTTNLPQRENF